MLLYLKVGTEWWPFCDTTWRNRSKSGTKGRTRPWSGGISGHPIFCFKYKALILMCIFLKKWVWYTCLSRVWAPFTWRTLHLVIQNGCCERLSFLSGGPSEVILSLSLPPTSQASTWGSPVIADSCSSPVPPGLCHNSAFILGAPWDWAYYLIALPLQNLLHKGACCSLGAGSRKCRVLESSWIRAPDAKVR